MKKNQKNIISLLLTVLLTILTLQCQCNQEKIKFTNDLWGLDIAMKKIDYIHCINNATTYKLQGEINKNNINAKQKHEHYIFVEKKAKIQIGIDDELIESILTTQNKEKKIYPLSNKNMFCAYVGLYQDNSTSKTVTDKDNCLVEKDYDVYYVITTEKKDIFFSNENKDIKLKSKKINKIPFQKNIQITIKNTTCQRNITKPALPLLFDIKADINITAPTSGWQKYTLFIEKKHKANPEEIITKMLKKEEKISIGFNTIADKKIIVYAVDKTKGADVMCNGEIDSIKDKKYCFKPGATYNVYTLFEDSTGKRIYYNKGKPAQIKVPEIIKIRMLEAKINKFIALVPETNFTTQYNGLISFEQLSFKIEKVGFTSLPVNIGFYFSKKNTTEPNTQVGNIAIDQMNVDNTNDRYFIQEKNKNISNNEKIDYGNNLLEINTTNSNQFTLGDTYHVYAFVVLGSITHYSENSIPITIPYANGNNMKKILDMADVHGNALSPNFEIAFDANHRLEAANIKDVDDIIIGSTNTLQHVKAGLIFNMGGITDPERDMLNVGRKIYSKSYGRTSLPYKINFPKIQDCINDVKTRKKNEYKSLLENILDEHTTYQTYLSIYGNSNGIYTDHNQPETVFITQNSKAITTPKYRNKEEYESNEEKMNKNKKEPNVVTYKNVIEMDRDAKIKIKKKNDNEYDIGRIKLNRNYQTGNNNKKIIKSEEVELDYTIFLKLAQEQKWTEITKNNIIAGTENLKQAQEYNTEKSSNFAVNIFKNIGSKLNSFFFKES